MPDWIELDPAYSTTRRVRKVAPEVVEAELKAAYEPEDQFETILLQPEGAVRKGEGGLRTQGYCKFAGIIPSPLSDDALAETKPLITVVTVVFNGEKFLEETILSVVNQTYDNVEYIVIDGSSTDGTLDIIRTYEHAIDYWVSEKDKGIYDAMNKGIDLAMGEWVNFMNCGDIFLNTHVVANAVKQLLSLKKDVALAYGGCAERTCIDELRYKSPRPHWWVYYGLFASHQSMFFRLEAILAGYDLRFQLAGDYALLAHFFISKKYFYRLDLTIAIVDTAGVSVRLAEQGRFECSMIRNEYLHVPHWISKMIFTAHKFMMTIRNRLPVFYEILNYRKK